ncbi:uncharacterized protein LOC126905401 [Daktulosphaira vitifoliae]|uniref:uncharacterized protein LOC126905401 n=1 Tax=Daktulosphaira vitifoliae TaxID=58002 RepID=UPI0021A9CF89|nr:uncharacterized protein LOC126905401 [Daktulosphaira vitifoliae]
MESKLNRQQNLMSTLSKPKNYSEQKKNTWSNLLQKKSVCKSTKNLESKKQNKSSSTQNCSKSVQCILPTSKICQSSTSLSIFNPVRTLQFLLREISHLPKVQNPDLTNIVHDMQIVVERIVDEYSELTNQNFIKINDFSAIPTKGEHFLENLNDKNKDKTYLTLVNKISDLENNNTLLTKQWKSAEEKLLTVTSERDELIRKLKDNCNSLEKFNKRERDYLDTISDLKCKLLVMEKSTNNKEIAIKEFTKRLMILSKTNEYTKKNNFKEPKEDDLIILPKENKSKTKKIKLYQDLTSQERFETNSEPVQFVFDNEIIKKSNSKFKKIDNISPSNTLCQLEEQCKENIEKNIDYQFNEYNQEATDLLSNKFELEKIFKNIKAKTNLSEKCFEQTKLNNDTELNDLSDEEDNYSDTSNIQSVKTHSIIN